MTIQTIKYLLLAVLLVAFFIVHRYEKEKALKWISVFFIAGLAAGLLEVFFENGNNKLLIKIAAGIINIGIILTLMPLMMKTDLTAKSKKEKRDREKELRKKGRPSIRPFR